MPLTRCMHVFHCLHECTSGLITAAVITFQVAVCLLACLVMVSLFVVSPRHSHHVRALELYFVHAACVGGRV